MSPTEAFCLLDVLMFVGFVLAYIVARRDALEERPRRVQELEESLTRLHKEGAARIEELRALRNVVYCTGNYAATGSDKDLEDLGRALCLALDRGYLDLARTQKALPTIAAAARKPPRPRQDHVCHDFHCHLDGDHHLCHDGACDL